MEKKQALLIAAMVKYDHGDAKRIQHFMKVHDFAATIGRLEAIDEETLSVLESAAIVHDIGIHISEQKYGSCAGPYQEKEGPAEARKLMESLHEFTEEQIARVCYLVGHHHTYRDIQGIDYQILVEADFLVNIFEDELPKESIPGIREKIFRTQAGKNLLDEMFLHDF